MSSPMDSTRGLFFRARNGDLEAREKLWKKLRERLCRYAHGRLPKRLRNLVETEDVVQDALAQTFRRVDLFDPKHSGAFGVALFVTMKRCLIDQHRRASRQPAAEGTVTSLAAEGLSPMEEAIEKEKLERVMTARSRLSEEDQALLYAKLELDLNWGDVALMFGKPSPDAARVGYERAVKRLVSKMVK
ncbi:MAG TPA: sigma-70 family RNA polymerase sigma factor [Thermoanaerobaculia bacterium]|nr:sigma-70 family RNA polymerase sigma factor [Thermoanaerobaculia bacterium]